jgi:flagellar biosynthesis/type III secretory pathway chaperone
MIIILGGINMFDIQEVIDKIETTDDGFKQALEEANNYTDIKTAINERITELLTQYSAAIKLNKHNSDVMYRKINEIEDEILNIVDALIPED